MGGGGGPLTLENFTETTAGDSGAPVTSITATGPGNISSNNLLAIVMLSEVESATYATTPSGWTKLIGYTGANAALTVLYKIASGSEGDVAITVDTGAHIAYYLRFTGANTTTPIDILGTATANRQASTVTTTVDGCIAIALTSYDGGQAVPITTSATGWTMEGSVRTGTGNVDASGGFASKTVTTAGASGSVLFDQFFEASCSVQFAIAPA